MKKQKVSYRFFRYEGPRLQAKKEIPFEMKLVARLMLDEMCFNWNKKQLEEKINDSLDEGNQALFLELSRKYKRYIFD